MNISSSSCEYSMSGCESGWTMYLDQLSNSTTHHNPFVSTNYKEENGALIQEDDEDLSMVSDASSGPPHYFHHDDDHYNIIHENINNNNNNSCGGGDGVYSQYYGYYTPHHQHHHEEKNKKSNNNKQQLLLQKSSKTKDQTNNIIKKHQINLCLDDTASSPVFDFSQDNVPSSDFSQVFSSANFEGGESMTKKKHFGFFKSSTKGKSGVCVCWLVTLGSTDTETPTSTSSKKLHVDTGVHLKSVCDS